MASYCSLADAKERMEATTNADDDTLSRLIRLASRQIDRLMYPRLPIFEPQVMTRSRPVKTTNVNTRTNVMTFGYPMLSLTTVTLGMPNSATTITSQVQLYPPNTSPQTQLLLTTYNRSWYNVCNTCATGGLFVTVTGEFGINKDYANAWVILDTLATAITTTTQTVFEVDDVDGDDEYGLPPRFSIGQLIRVDSEYMEIINTNAATNEITVRRGQNGTTAATHLIGANVAVYRPDLNIRNVAARQAGLLYARQGAYTTVTVEPTGTEIRYPADLLVELRAALQEYSYGAEF